MEVKGVAISSLPVFVKTKLGDQAYNKWLNSLSIEAAEVYGSTILAYQWYPLKKVFIEPTKKICELFYDGNLRGAWEAGRFSAENALKGIYKLFVKLGSPEFIIKKANTIMPTYYRPSTMELIELEKKRAVLHITEFPEPDTVIDYRICGWIEKALEISGCKNLKIKITKALTKNDELTEFVLTWD